MTVKVPWAVWSEEKPTGALKTSWEAYLRLLNEVIEPGAANRKDWQRRRDAWVQAHLAAGYGLEVARKSFDAMEAEKEAHEAELRREGLNRLKAERAAAEAAREAAYNAPEAVEARRLKAIAEAEAEAEAAARVMSLVVVDRERIAAIANPLERDRKLLDMLLSWANYLTRLGCHKAAKPLYDERHPIMAQEQERRAQQQQAMQGYFAAAGGRRRWVYVERSKGRTLQSIADAGGLTKERVRQLCQAEEARPGEAVGAVAAEAAAPADRPAARGG